MNDNEFPWLPTVILFTVLDNSSSLLDIVSRLVFMSESADPTISLLISTLSLRFPRLSAPLEAMLSILGKSSLVVSIESDADSVSRANVFIM